jgi:hypothetical protein
MPRIRLSQLSQDRRSPPTLDQHQRAQRLAHKVKMVLKTRGKWHHGPKLHKAMRRHDRFLEALRAIIRGDATDPHAPTTRAEA